MNLLISVCVLAMSLAPPPALAEDRIQTRLRQMLDIPESVQGPVSLDLKQVTLAAMLRSDSFRALMAKTLSLETEALEQESLTDASLVAQAKQEWNRNQPNSLFGTNRFDQTSVELGIEKRFSTGTRFGFGVNEFRNNSSFGSFGVIDTKLAGARLTLSQSLWRDSFGSSTVKLLESGRIKSRARTLQLESELEDWFLQLANLYHQVWATQRQIEATRASLDRKERLALLFERRKSLGISEEAEQIQIESAVSQSRVQLEELVRILQKQWVLLAVSLKLDEEDRLTDPTRIPVGIGNPETEKDLLCTGTVEKNREIRQLELEVDAIRIQTRVAIDQMRPDLTLDLGLGTNGSVLNGVDDFGLRWMDTLRARYPAYSVGLLFRMPLDGSREKSQILSAAAGSAQLESRLSEIRSRLASDLETQCAELSMLGRHTSLYTDLEKEQKRRITLEETRYRQARSSPFTVLQAGEELYGTTLSLNRTRAEALGRHWAIKKVKGLLFNELDSWIREKTGKTLFENARERSPR